MKMPCQTLKRLSEIKLKCLSFGCSCNKFTAGGEVILDSILSHAICPYLVYICYPYYETFHAGGSFPWMKDLNTVIVSCPHADAAVDMEIRRRFNKDKIEISGEIINAKSNCLWGCKKGMRIEFDLPPLQDMCFRAYHFLFPHMFSLSSVENKELTISVQCPKSNGTVFEISKRKS